MAGVSETKPAQLFVVASSTVSKAMTALEKEGKTSLLKLNCGRRRNLSFRGRRTLTRIVWKDDKNTAPKISAAVNDHFENPVSLKTVRRELHKVRFLGRAAIRKPIKITLKFPDVSIFCLTLVYSFDKDLWCFFIYFVNSRDNFTELCIFRSL